MTAYSVKLKPTDGGWFVTVTSPNGRLVVFEWCITKWGAQRLARREAKKHRLLVTNRPVERYTIEVN